MKIIIALFAIAALIFGAYELGQKSALKTLPAVKTEEQIRDDIKKDLVELTRKDFEEYQNLKTLEERYKKADEILGKMVVLFLADLGVRLGYKPVDAAALEKSCPTNPTPVVATESPRPAASPPKSEASWQSSEGAIVNAATDDAAIRALKKAEIPDIASAVLRGRVVNLREARSIEGHFAGEILFTDRKTYPVDWNVEWEVVLRGGSQSQNSSYVSLTKKNETKPFSLTRGTGSLKDFIKAEGSRGVIVNVMANEAFIQIYPQGGGHTWVGNYYEKFKGEFKVTGRVRVNKL